MWRAIVIGSIMLTLLTLFIALSPRFVHPESLVWSDEFDHLDESKWQHLVTTYPLVCGDMSHCHAHLTIFVPFRMIFNIIAITGPTAGWVAGRCIWCRPSPPRIMERTSFTMAALTSTLRGAPQQNVQVFCLDNDLLQDPEHPCNIWYDQDNLCSDCSGEDIVKPIQLARLHSNVSAHRS